MNYSYIDSGGNDAMNASKRLCPCQTTSDRETWKTAFMNGWYGNGVAIDSPGYVAGVKYRAKQLESS